MQRGGSRPASEFVDGGEQRRRPRAPQRSSAIETPQAGHIDLRIVRKVDLKTQHWADWHEYLDDMGAENHHLGTTKSLGSVAITYVPAKHMNTMLREKYPRDFHHHKGKVELFRKVNRGISFFLRDQAHYAGDMQIDCLQAAHDADRRAHDSAVDEILADAGLPRPAGEATTLTIDEQVMLEEYAFGPLTMSVRGIDLYGKARVGLDLSKNAEAYQERHAIVGHLRHEGLPVHMLDADWAPHATVFRMHEHLAVEQLTTAHNPPVEISFMPPKTESYGI